MAYKRSIYLVNPKFQLKFSLYVCAILFLSSIIYPITIYDLMSSFIEYAEQVNPQVTNQLEEKRKSLVIILSLWQIGFTSLVFVICIFFSHKIAGPIYKMQKFLRGIRDGLDHGTLFFRKGDYFSELADDFNETFEQIREDYKKDFVYISEVNAYLNNLSMVVPDDKKIVLKEITQRLSEIQERFNSK